MSLSYIHSKGIVHRNIKPSNIYQGFIGDKEIFLLTEFGSYAQINGNVSGPSTKKQNIKQNVLEDELESQDAHPSLDIWALGMILYWLMAG